MKNLVLREWSSFSICKIQKREEIRVSLMTVYSNSREKVNALLRRGNFVFLHFSEPLRGPIEFAVETDEDVWKAFCFIASSPVEAFLNFLVVL